MGAAARDRVEVAFSEAALAERAIEVIESVC